ncbi:DOPA-like domain-containing protein [Hypoxylon sp. NC1633]|nr:DOPA-like domain-containing protein [Hypoxylon sp. NC1633]
MAFAAGKYTYPSPLQGYEDAPPLPDEKNDDGKSFKNPARESLSNAYLEFPDPLDKSRRGGFDVHIYYLQHDESQTKYARELWERIRREFPELRIYRFWDRPVGPHPIAMFEVNLFTPAQFGAFISWLAIYRGPLSALIHPNTVEAGEGVPKHETERRNHSERAIWMGERINLDLDIFERFS